MRWKLGLYRGMYREIAFWDLCCGPPTCGIIHIYIYILVRFAVYEGFSSLWGGGGAVNSLVLLQVSSPVPGLRPCEFEDILV